MTARLRRVEKLIQLADDALKAARASQVAATRAVVAARLVVERDERCWSAAAAGFAVAVTRISDLDQQASHAP